MRDLKPGVLSGELRRALGMSENSPPPWLINMQRYGPPPSYPDLKVAGLNAPIPPGAAFGCVLGKIVLLLRGICGPFADHIGLPWWNM